MKNEKLTPVRPRPMGKGELAMKYAPNLLPDSAVKRLMKWIRLHPQLTAALEATHYDPKQRIFTVRQVELIFEYLGEP